MPFMQIDEVIHRLRSLHEKLRACYSVLADAQPDERTKLMLQRMQQYEREVEEGLTAFLETADAEIREQWVQYVANTNARQAIETVDFHTGLDPDEIVQRAVQLDNALQYLCKSIAGGRVTGNRVREAFRSILELEEAKSRERSKLLAQLSDS